MSVRMHVRPMVIGVALGVVVTVLVLVLLRGNPASAASGQREDTITQLTAKVHKLQTQWIALHLAVQELQTGQPGISLSPGQMFSRLQAVESRLFAICRTGRVVTGVSLIGNQLSVQNASC